MFKPWRSDKKKIKAVFKLQFQATQVPQLKKPALLISLMPEDVGKTTFKLEKAAVQDGTCLWENPIFVTVKLIRHIKTGKLNEKIYHFIVASGSSKSGYLGEASIDFADFADETEPLTVSLPLKFANSGAVLHVTVQRVLGGTDQRYNEDYGDSAIPRDESLRSQLSNGHTDGDEDGNLDILLLENDDHDGSFKESRGSNASIQQTFKQNSMPRNVPVDTHGSKNRLHRRSSTDWSMGSVSDGSLVDSTNSLDNELAREVQGTSDESIEKLKSEISNLQRQSELSEMELQSLRKQVAKESLRTQDLSRQTIELKEERDAFKTECVQLRSSQRSVDGEILNRLKDENKDLQVQLEEMRRELSDGKEMNNHLKLQLQKTQDSNSELILAVRDLEDMLEQKNMEISQLSVELEVSKNSDENQGKKCNCARGEDNRQSALALGVSGREKNDGELDSLRQKIDDLLEEIELYRQDREKLENYIEKLTQDYADLQQENHEFCSKLEQSKLQELKIETEHMESLATIDGLELQVERLEEKLKKQTEEFSESLSSTDELERHIKALKKELEKQAAQFENDLNTMTKAKIEQEQRAIRAEEALRNTRWKNAVTAERLQEEIKRLSVEMSGKFDENEKLLTKATAEANEQHAQNQILEERLQKSNEEISLIREQSQVKVEELTTQLALQTNHVEQMSIELEAKSQQLRNTQEQTEEKQEAFSVEIQMLKTKIEMLTKQKNNASVQDEQLRLRDETEKLEKSLLEKEVLIKRGNKERDELERNYAIAKKEAEKLQEELLCLSSLKNEKETLVEKLFSEAESVKCRHEELKQSLSKQELEKANLQKQVLDLKHELKKEKRKEGSNEGQASVALGRYDSNISELLTEMTQIKERNKAMEKELKDMQERYSEISLKFAEVEGERQQLVMTVRNLKSGKKN